MFIAEITRVFRKRGLSASKHPRLATRLAVAIVVAITGALACAACSKGDENGAERCGSSVCADGSVCLAGECKIPCTGSDDCLDGESCKAAGAEPGVCERTSGRFTACESNAQCDVGGGFSCVAGLCRAPCQTHFDCRSVGRCAPLGGGAYCTDEGAEPLGRYYSACPNGPAQCDDAAGFVCLGAGIGDLDAYCATDCVADKDCPEGFQCGTSGASPCQAACGVPGDPTRSNCVPASQIGPGRQYECGALGLVRHLCEKKSFCSRCETDRDCLAVSGQICALDASGEKICTVTCDPSVDSCPWGNAGECGNWDTGRGTPTCAHRFGSCRGTGKGCEPCTEDRDCGERGFCSSSSFTGERFCIDLSVACDCANDADANDLCTGHGCPETPGELAMTCYAGSRFARDPLQNRCIGSSTSGGLQASPQSGCWPLR